MILLAILDGFGITDNKHKNAIICGNTPFIDYIVENFPTRTIYAHGEYVGLPKGQMGNSEVGHLNIGGGREIRPDLVVINDLISNGGFYKNEVLVDFIQTVKKRRGRIHLMGLLSDGGIHSHIRHLEALLRMINDNGPVVVFLHAYLDGRDTEPDVADRYVKQAQEMVDRYPGMYISTIGGRSWGMDRDNNWPRVERHYNAIVKRDSDVHAASALDGVSEALKRGETDEFVVPTVIDLPAGIDGRILDGDGIIHFNFRADRAIQMTSALTQSDFDSFDTGRRPKIDMVTFTLYYEYQVPKVAFEGEILHHTLTEEVTSAGKTVFKIAETEKWAHVTKFFNGGVMDQFPGEDRLLVQSPLDVRPYYDKKPEMSAYEITDRLVERVGKYDLIVVNYANADMVGHTGNFEAACRAVEAVDACLKRVYDAVDHEKDTMIIIGDHGNADEMVDEHGHPDTKHTTNMVPFYVLNKHVKLREDVGALKDVAPTILYLMNIPKPDVMTGRSLVI